MLMLKNIQILLDPAMVLSKLCQFNLYVQSSMFSFSCLFFFSFFFVVVQKENAFCTLDVASILRKKYELPLH